MLRPRSNPWPFVAILVCTLVAAVAMWVLVTYENPRSMQSTGPLFDAINPRIPTAYRFQPKADITAYELAVSLAPMMGSTEFLPRIKPYIDAMPPNAKRHWIPPSEKSDEPPH